MIFIFKFKPRLRGGEHAPTTVFSLQNGQNGANGAVKKKTISSSHLYYKLFMAKMVKAPFASLFSLPSPIFSDAENKDQFLSCL